MIYFISEDVVNDHNIGTIKGERVTVLKDILTSPDKDVIWDIDDFRSQTSFLKYAGIDYRVIIGVPEYHTPSDFMSETDQSKIASFDQVMKTTFGKERLSVIEASSTFSSGVMPDINNQKKEDDLIENMTGGIHDTY